LQINPVPSMYGIFTYIYHKNQPNVGKYTIHGWYGNGWKMTFPLGMAYFQGKNCKF